jgi:hypothetical protein
MKNYGRVNLHSGFLPADRSSNDHSGTFNAEEMSLRSSKTKKLAKQKADKWFSLYIRLRDADSNGFVRCCTSGKIMYWKDADAGHYISRRFEAVRYDERNCHAQSKQENRFHNGNQLVHQRYIEERYGKGTAEELFTKSRMKCFRKKHDYEMIAQKFYQKVKTLQP